MQATPGRIWSHIVIAPQSVPQSPVKFPILLAVGHYLSLAHFSAAISLALSWSYSLVFIVYHLKGCTEPVHLPSSLQSSTGDFHKLERDS